MRWYNRPHGDWRLITKFLLLPRCVQGEWRWLERATIAQQFNHGFLLPSFWSDEFWYDQPDQPIFVGEHRIRALCRDRMAAAGIDVKVITMNKCPPPPPPPPLPHEGGDEYERRTGVTLPRTETTS